MMINWRKSSYSTNEGACVEIGCPVDSVDYAHIRDSKAPDQGHLTFSPMALQALVEHITR